MTFNTGNPIGSTDARDRSDNSENLDFAVNSLSPTFVDRLGATRDTLEGIYQKSAYYRVGTFDDGYTLTNNRQTLAYGNVEYSWSGAFPKVVAAGSAPATSGGVGVNAWIDRTQETLKLSLLSNSGASIVYTSTGATVEERLSSQDTSIAGKASLEGSVSQAFSVADAATDTQAASYSQVKSRTKKGGLTQSISGNALTLSYAARLLQFRNETLTDGTAVEATPSAAMGLVVPNGAKLGGSSGVPMEFLVLGILNGGSPVIGVVNANGGLILDETGLISTTAISASATSASTIYTTEAVTNSPYVILAHLTVTLPTAGAWSVLPTVIPTDLVGVGFLMKRVLYPAVSTTSGTSIGFQIPSWAKKITLSIAGLSTNGTSNIVVKAGVAGVAQPTGYNSGAFQYTNSLSVSTTAFVLALTSAASVYSGAVEFIKQSDTTWCANGAISSAIYPTSISIGGSVSLSSVLDSLFLTTVNGTDTFDAGFVSILVEG